MTTQSEQQATVAEEKRNLETLRQIEERYRLIMQNVQDFALMVLDLQGRIIDWNEGTERVFGYAEDEVSGRHFSRLFLPEDIQARRPERELQQAAETGRAEDENWLLRRDGSRFWAIGVTTALKDEHGHLVGFVKLVQDRTAQKETLEALRAREERFRVIFENSWDAVSLLDADGTIRYASPSTTRILGFLPEEIVGRNTFDYFHPDDLASARALFAQLCQKPGSRVKAEFRYRRKDGTWRWFEGTGTNLLAEPGVAAIVANYHDITDRKRLEQALWERAEQLAEADRRKDELLAVLGHELRNPLAAVVNGVQVLHQGGTKGPIAEQALDVVQRQLTQVTRLVDDLFDLARTARGEVTLRKERADLVTAARYAVEASRTAIEARSHQLSVSLPSEPLPLEADPARLQQIITNLLTNAARYSEPGGQLTLTVERQGDQGVVRLRDTGIDIPPNLLPHVFDLFSAGGVLPEPALSGLRLGLALVKRLVELHGGAVKATSDGPGNGSEFVVLLPLLPTSSEKARVSPAAAVPGGRLLRLLVVEDDRDVAGSLARMLRLWGHEVRVAYDGPQALEAATEQRPDLVLLDLGLPGLDGYEVARRLRQRPEFAGVRLVALTAYGEEEHRRRAREAGFDHHLTKPVAPDDLRQLLKSEPSVIVEQDDAR